MRSISIVALAVALAAGQFAASEIALAATAGPLQPGQTNAQADCPAAAPSGTADPSANSACGQAKFSWHIVEQHPGFWTLDQVAPGSSRNAADPQPAVLQPTAPQIADAPAPSGGPGCTSYPLPIVLNGQPQQATVIACPQANGSWQTTRYTPGLPPQVYTVPAQAADASSAAAASPDDYGAPSYYSYGDWAGLPWFYGFAPAVVTGQGFDRFRNARGFGFARASIHGVAHGFDHGFAHGFNHGVARGFVRGVAASGHGGFAGGHGGFASMHR
jgi:hypothetical protein